VADPLLEAAVIETEAPAAPEHELGGLLGRGAATAFGAARSATLGMSDLALTEAANLLGGDSYRKEMARGLSTLQTVNPYSTLGGELGGMFVPGSAMGGLTGMGEAVELGTTARLGEGLLGKTASMSLRGGAETLAIDAGKALSEDALGDPDENAEKLFAGTSKDVLLGVTLGAGLGAGSHFLSEASSLLSRSRGPVPSRFLDEVAGVEGAGRLVREEASGAQKLIDDLRVAGATTDDAAKMADDVGKLAVAKAGPLSSAVADVAARYVAAKGANPETAEVLAKGYSERATRLAKQEEILDASARRLADKGTRVMRNLEDTANEVQFTYKAEQMAHLVDPSRANEAADAVARMLQDVDGTLSLLEGTATRGGAEVAVKRIRNSYKDVTRKLTSLGDEASAAARQNIVRDLFIEADNLKRTIGKGAGFGKSQFGLSEGAREFDELYHRLQQGLQDETVWGRAGAAQREWNETFASLKPRRDDFGNRFSVSIDAVSGRPVAEMDAGKVKGFLKQLGGAEADQAVKSTEAVVEGLRRRAEVIKKYGTLTGSEASRLESGLAELDDFEKTFRASQKEAETVAKLRTMQLEEQGKGLGGILGLGADILTRPLTTMERMASVRATVEKFENGLRDGIAQVFNGSKGAMPSAAKAPAREALVEEIGRVRELSAQPLAMQERVAKAVGDLTKHAPRTAESVGLTATRLVTFLSSEAPQPRVPVSAFGGPGKPRYSDMQLAQYSRVREAALDPTAVVRDMKAGKLNRDGIRAVEFVYPKLFAQMQEMARDEIERLAVTGKLDAMPYAQKAAISTLLKVPADETWQPDFIALMQASRQTTQESRPAPPSMAPVGPSKRAIKLDTEVFKTPAQLTEGGGNA
jgi:hypothetical protein